ncbi:hypothetical protein [Paenisporosarcina indica]|uniref:hypothetical protein n=1 Tax=Paenisporosarcina indica TaxID=650093 RepID=UPI000B09EF1A|nr:hypothetical protein [Paenisporosarcina indica]
MAIGIRYQSQGDIYIQLNGNQHYLNKIEKEIKEIVSELTKETIYKDNMISVALIE